MARISGRSARGASRQQSAELAALAAQARRRGPAARRPTSQRAKDATDAFAAWLEAQAPSKTGPSGVGIENYDWYLKNVQLVPYTWQDEVTLMERELARAHAFLALEEQRNAQLPPQAPIASADEHDARASTPRSPSTWRSSSDHDILTDPRLTWIRRCARASARFTPGPREFFTEVDYRDPEVMRTHGYHWFDLGRMAQRAAPEPDPARRRCSTTSSTRAPRGTPPAWEEMMLQAGMFDARPRSRELIYVLLAERAARALGDLRMHANEFTLEQAAAVRVGEHAARLAAASSGNLVRGEQHLYLQQPAYGTSYIIGKIEIEQLLAERRRQLGDAFTHEAIHGRVRRGGPDPGLAAALGADRRAAAVSGAMRHG